MEYKKLWKIEYDTSTLTQLIQVIAEDIDSALIMFDKIQDSILDDAFRSDRSDIKEIKAMDYVYYEG